MEKKEETLELVSDKYNDPQKQRLNRYLNILLLAKGSDLHIKPTNSPRIRVNGEIEQIEDEDKYSAIETMSLIKELLRTQFAKFTEEKEIDFTYAMREEEKSDIKRFRVNAFFQKDGVSLVFRTIPNEIMTLKELNIPENIKKIINIQRGLILVTGATGAGKSTTLASIINEINMTQKKHILSIEDPIEFIHEDKLSIINQRSVGQDTKDFHSALRSALREDPDIILIGEIRDTESVEMALHAAETGHLVFATLHTSNASESIKRLIGMYAANEQDRVRFVLSKTLTSIISQRLVKTKDNKRIPAIEFLINTARIQQLIAEKRESEIEATLDQFSVQYGTHSFDQHLYDLYKGELITRDNALLCSSRPDNLKLKLQGIGEKEGTMLNKEGSGLKIKFDDEY